MRVVIAGAGSVGRSIARELLAHDHEVTIIDESAKSFQNLLPDFSGRTIQGSVLSREVLERASLAGADGFAAVTNSDTVNAVPCTVPLRCAIGGRRSRSQRSRVSVSKQTNVATTPVTIPMPVVAEVSAICVKYQHPAPATKSRNSGLMCSFCIRLFPRARSSEFIRVACSGE